MVTETDSQRIDFNNWLSQCPVMWTRQNISFDEETATYVFHFEPLDDDDD